MKRLIIVTMLFLASSSSLIPQESPEKAKILAEKTKSTQQGIDGVWTQVCMECDGSVASSMPSAPPLSNSPAGGFFLWKITADKIEMGPHKYAYDLNPEKTGAFDVFPLDKEGKRVTKQKMSAIYSLNGDYLLICLGRAGAPPPEQFTTSSSKPGCLHVLRRGDLGAKKKR